VRRRTSQRLETPFEGSAGDTESSMLLLKGAIRCNMFGCLTPLLDHAVHARGRAYSWGISFQYK
jgi:hypothetical protein